MNHGQKSKQTPNVKVPLPKGSHADLFERTPISKTVTGSVSKKLTSKVKGGNWNDGGR